MKKKIIFFYKSVYMKNNLKFRNFLDLRDEGIMKKNISCIRVYFIFVKGRK